MTEDQHRQEDEDECPGCSFEGCCIPPEEKVKPRPPKVGRDWVW